MRAKDRREFTKRAAGFEPPPFNVFGEMVAAGLLLGDANRRIIVVLRGADEFGGGDDRTG